MKFETSLIVTNLFISGYIRFTRVKTKSFLKCKYSVFVCQSIIFVSRIITPIGFDLNSKIKFLFKINNQTKLSENEK